MFWLKQRHSSMRCCVKWSTSQILLWQTRCSSTPHTSYTTGFRSGLLGGHINGEMKIWCIARQKLHGVTELGELSIVLLESEEVSSISIFHIGNFCFWVPFLKQLLLRNCAVDFVGICNVYVGKMIIEAAERIFNSDKICRSYSDLNFGVTFLEHYYWSIPTDILFCAVSLSQIRPIVQIYEEIRSLRVLSTIWGGGLWQRMLFILGSWKACSGLPIFVLIELLLLGVANEYRLEMGIFEGEGVGFGQYFT